MFKLSNLLLNPKKAKRHPFEMFIVGFFYTSISIVLSLWIFPDYASLVMVFLTVLATLYIIQGALILEERKEKMINSEKFLFRRHFKTLSLLLCLFIGFMTAFVFWTIILPQSTTEVIFSLQQSTVEGIRSITGNATANGTFSTIVLNNLRVAGISLLFALFYGAGSIFILAWNASVMGFVIGIIVKDSLGLISLPLVFMKYLIHGVPEMFSYFLVSLAGGIVFITIVKEDFSKERVKRTVIDVIMLLALSIVILLVAALLEVYISPLI